MSEQDQNDHQSFASNPWWLFSAGFIVLVLAGLGFVLLTDPPNDTPVPTPGPASATATNAPQVAGRPTSACATSSSSSSLSIPTAAPASEWSIVDKVAVPTSKAGPSVLSPNRRCFDRSSEGALLAASNIGMLSFGKDAAAIFASQVLPGPNHDAALKEAVDQRPREGDKAQIRGFRFLNYSPDRAQVQLLTGIQEQLQQFTITVQWSEGDWKVNLDTPGGYLPPQPASSADGFIQWSGV